MAVRQSGSNGIITNGIQYGITDVSNHASARPGHDGERVLGPVSAIEAIGIRAGSVTLLRRSAMGNALNTRKYRLSFTFGGLLIPETQMVADAYVRLGDWEDVRKEVLAENLLRKTRQESSRRYFGEIRDRLKSAHQWELPVIAGREGGPDETKLVILAVTVRYYRVIWDFLVEVVRYKIAGGDYRMLGFEFDSFWEQKAAAAPEMHEVTETTRLKLAQVAYRMLEEAGFLPGGRTGTIIAPTVPYGLSTRYAAEHDSAALMAFLLPDYEIARLSEETRE